MNLLALLFAAAMATQPAYVVPVHQERGVLFLEARVNGTGPLLFTFDPGANDLYTSYARERLRGRVPYSVCLAAACFPAVMDYFGGDPADLDPRHDVALGIIAGSIGPQLLRHYVARIDYRASTLTLIPPAQFQPPPVAERLAISFDSYGMPVIGARVNGINGLFELDVRAPSSMLFAPFVARTRMQRARAVQSLQISGVEMRDVLFRFSNDKTGKFANAAVAGLLGNNVLSHFVVTLDFPHRSAYLIRAHMPDAAARVRANRLAHVR